MISLAVRSYLPRVSLPIFDHESGFLASEDRSPLYLAWQAQARRRQQQQQSPYVKYGWPSGEGLFPACDVGVKLWLHDNESSNEIMGNRVPHMGNMTTDKRAMGRGTRSRHSFHIWKLGQTYRTLRAETTRMHTIPARPSPPPRANPHALQKGHAHHMPITAQLCTPSTHHYTRVNYARLLLHIIDSTAINNHLPHRRKSKYAFDCGTILSYQVKFFWSMTNPVPSSDTVMTKRFAPTTILRRFVVVRYRSPDNASEDLGYRSIQRLIASGKALLIHCEHHSLCA